MSQSPYRIDQCSDIHQELLRVHASGTLDHHWHNDIRYGNRWKAFVPLGRGRGRPPKFHIKIHRGNHYRASNALKSCGATHVALFNNKGVNSCAICNHIGKTFEPTALDYYPFYRTGEIFTWYDPKWLAGYIPCDPRSPEQPEDSPLVMKWICDGCYRMFLTNVEINYHSFHEKFWGRLGLSVKPDGRSRVLVDRRVANAAWFTVTEATERRLTSRRSTDGEPWSKQLDLIITQMKQRAA